MERHKAPSAKRCIKTLNERDICPNEVIVTKHRAPKGALRHEVVASTSRAHLGHKAPSAKRCIKTSQIRVVDGEVKAGHKEPSAKRCIKTSPAVPSDLRCPRVTKHRAPKGALRHWTSHLALLARFPSHKAPSAKRCIKTDLDTRLDTAVRCHKAPSAKRCIKTGAPPSSRRRLASSSQSTERQKVH